MSHTPATMQRSLLALAWRERAVLSSSSRYTCASFDERIQFQPRVVPKPSLLILASSASASAISDDLRSTYTVQLDRMPSIPTVPVSKAFPFGVHQSRSHHVPQPHSIRATRCVPSV